MSAAELFAARSLRWRAYCSWWKRHSGRRCRSATAKTPKGPRWPRLTQQATKTLLDLNSSIFHGFSLLRHGFPSLDTPTSWVKLSCYRCSFTLFRASCISFQKASSSMASFFFKASRSWSFTKLSRRSRWSPPSSVKWSATKRTFKKTKQAGKQRVAWRKTVLKVVKLEDPKKGPHRHLIIWFVWGCETCKLAFSPSSLNFKVVLPGLPQGLDQAFCLLPRFWASFGPPAASGLRVKVQKAGQWLRWLPEAKLLAKKSEVLQGEHHLKTSGAGKIPKNSWSSSTSSRFCKNKKS